MTTTGRVNSTCDRAARPAAPASSAPAGCLVVAPYVGEFGWELMNWQARVRRRLETEPFRRVIVACGRGKRRMYEHPRAEVIEVDLSGISGEPCDDRRVDGAGSLIAPAVLRDSTLRCTLDCILDPRGGPASRRVGGTPDAAAREQGDMLDAMLADAELWTPPFDGGLWPADGRGQRFVSFRDAAARDTAALDGPDVVLVQRRRGLAPQRNLPDAWWRALSDELRRRGLSVRDCPHELNAAIELLSRAGLAVGGSTGGLHLASLCECPHYVWGPGDDERWTAWSCSNRQRYETLWNPLGTPVIYDALGWRPALEDAAAGIVRAFARISRRAAPDAAGSFRRRWRLKRAMAAIWLGDASRYAPWRVRRWMAGAC